MILAIFVHPKRIELLSEVPETSILSIELQVQMLLQKIYYSEKQLQN